MKYLLTLILSTLLCNLQAQNFQDSLLLKWKNEELSTEKRLKTITKYLYEQEGKTNHDSVLQLANEILKAADQTNSAFYKAVALYYLGDYEIEKSNYESAVEYFSKSRSILSVLDSISWLAKATNAQGIVYRQLGIKNEAIKLFKEASKLYLKNKNENGIAKIDLNIGVIYSDLGNWKKGAKYSQKAAEYYRKTKDYEGLMFALNNLGSTYNDHKEYEKAIQNLRLAKINMNKSNADYLKIGIIYTLGEAMFKQGKIDSGLYFIEKAVELADNSSPYLKSIVYSRAGICFVEAGRFKDAGTICNNALKISQNIKSLDAQKNCYKCLTKAFMGLNEGKLSAKYFNRLESINDSLENEKAAQKLFELEFNKNLIKDSIAQVEEEKALVLELKKEQIVFKRKNRIQYSLVVIVVLLLATIIAVASKFKISPRLASGLIFIFFILTFEFLLVVLDPWVDSISNGEVGWKIAINTAIALVLFGIHQISERGLKKAIIKSNG
ncbi:MAG: tetratricopeptide repeat protein [Bacteroidia bacterium]